MEQHTRLVPAANINCSRHRPSFAVTAVSLRTAITPRGGGERARRSAGRIARDLPRPTLCGVCGEECKRGDVARLGPFVYVEDGFSDRCVAKAASRVFARDGLATYLAARVVSFEPYDDFCDVADALDGGAVVPPGRRRGRNT
jgi:hypothetical protein